ADEGSEVVVTLKIRRSEKLAQPHADHLRRTGPSVHYRECVIAFDQFPMLQDACDLFVFRQLDIDGLFKLDAPDRVGAQFDESPVTVFALTTTQFRRWWFLSTFTGHHAPAGTSGERAHSALRESERELVIVATGHNVERIVHREERLF